ncbi:MAG: hypothetical protein IJ344_02150, partial [Clostridia bacterium]|nr:hypothetical protein [Clostridia bacterium]
PSPSSSSSLSREELVTAVYLGVHEAEEHKSDFTYRFLIDEQERILKIADDDHFSIQNSIKVGYSYELVLEEETVTHAAEMTSSLTHPPLPPVSVKPGKKTLKNLLATALLPMGNALYVYGGGWNWQDNGSSAQASSIGISPYWSTFFYAQNATYSYKEPNGEQGTVYYPVLGVNEYYFAGLDCSGYLGWVLYNTVENESGKEGFVTSSTKFAKNLEQKGLGSVSNSCTELLPGDIVSMKGHVWLCIGRCDDGSVVIAHSTPSSSREGFAGGGVQLSALGSDKSCEAYQLADHYMKKYFPVWYDRYGVILCNPSKYTDLRLQNTGRFSFDISENGVLSDEEGISAMSAQEILSLLFEE